MSGKPSSVWICARGSTATNNLGTMSIWTRRFFAQRTRSIASSIGRSKNATTTRSISRPDDLREIVRRAEDAQAVEHVRPGVGGRVDESHDVDAVLLVAEDLPGDELGDRVDAHDHGVLNVRRPRAGERAGRDAASATNTIAIAQKVSSFGGTDSSP